MAQMSICVTSLVRRVLTQRIAQKDEKIAEKFENFAGFAIFCK